MSPRITAATPAATNLSVSSTAPERGSVLGPGVAVWTTWQTQLVLSVQLGFLQLFATQFMLEGQSLFVTQEELHEATGGGVGVDVLLPLQLPKTIN